MRKKIGYFNTFIDYIKHFKDHFYLVTPLNEEAHVKIFHLEPSHTPVCMNVFREYLNQSHYLTEVGSYLYKEGGLSQEELYLKAQLVAFCKELRYFGGDFSS